jgi:predicted metal-dependent peptidase
MMIEKKLQIAKSKLMLEHPYFGALASTLKFEKSDDIEAFQSDGNSFVYNDDYLATLSNEELSFALANASMHKALSHQSRKAKRMSWMWQLSMDYAINSILVENGLVLPQHVNYDSRFDGKYAEEIYEILKSEIDHKDQDEESQESDEEESLDENKEKKIDQQKAQIDEELIEEFERFLDQISHKAQEQGNLPKGLERIIKVEYDSKINWRDELYRYVNNHAKSDYRFFPPNMKYLYLGFALPAIYGEHLKIVVAIDTSASVDSVLLAKFLSELEQIMQVFPNYEIDLIECDAKIHTVKTYYPTETLETTLKGGGGTDFRPVFEYVENENLDRRFLIYFTDGMGVFPTFLPKIDTLWVMPEMVEVPFGEVLRLENV